MPSGFVSGGTIDNPKEAWLQAHKDLESSQREKREAATQDGGKSLYEVLQANKAAKQSQYEESLRLKNQFRSLNDDEIDFLDSVLESTRENERKIKQETVKMLDEFRTQRAEADKTVLDDQPIDAGDGEKFEQGMSWGKKRKRKEKDSKAFNGTKLRRSSTPEEAINKQAASADISTEAKDTLETMDKKLNSAAVGPETRAATGKTTLQSKTLPQQASATSSTVVPQQMSPSQKPKLGLVGYWSSDSESD